MADTLKFVGDGFKSATGGWDFEKINASDFNQHVKKSVPFYSEGHALTAEFSHFFLRPNDTYYDLGCSTGLLTKKIFDEYSRAVIAVGVDNKQNMIDEALKAKSEQDVNLHFVNKNLLDFEFGKAEFITSYYTLQFLKKSKRHECIQKIFASLTPGGGFVIFEKTISEDPVLQDFCSQLYIDFKLKSDFNGNEIVAKSNSLRGVLSPQTGSTIIDEVKQAGFSRVGLIFKYLSFEGYLCIK